MVCQRTTRSLWAISRSREASTPLCSSECYGPATMAIVLQYPSIVACSTDGQVVFVSSVQSATTRLGKVAIYTHPSLAYQAGHVSDRRSYFARTTSLCSTRTHCSARFQDPCHLAFGNGRRTVYDKSRSQVLSRHTASPCTAPARPPPAINNEALVLPYEAQHAPKPF